MGIWENYLRLFLADDVFLIAVKNTLLFAVITGPVSYLLCFVFAWLMNELKPKIKAFLTLLFMLRRILSEHIPGVDSLVER